MATTEHPDDTILDDELDENDFNFDNENEDALLAETEYDFEEKNELEKPTAPVDNTETEEDVLDIGIAEEDIVEAEPPAPVPSVTSRENSISPTVDEITDFSVEGNRSECGGNDGVNGGNDDDNTKKSDADIKDSLEETDERNVESSPADESVETKVSKEEERATEKNVKSKVISLKRCPVKNYDNLPALAKVIGQTHPPSGSQTSLAAPSSSSFRNSKSRGKEHGSDMRNRKSISSSNSSRKHTDSSHKRRYDYEDSRRNDRRRYAVATKESSSSTYRDDEPSHYKLEEYGSSKRISRVEDSSRSNKYDDYAPDSKFDSTVTRQVYDQTTSYRNTSTEFTHQSIVASVQITQERYQITSDSTALPASDGPFQPQFCDVGLNTALSLPPPPGVRPLGPPQSPHLPPYRPQRPDSFDGSGYALPPPGPPQGSCPPPGYHPRPMAFPPRPMQPPLMAGQLPPPGMNRLPAAGGVAYPNQNGGFPPRPPHPQPQHVGQAPHMRPIHPHLMNRPMPPPHQGNAQPQFRGPWMPPPSIQPHSGRPPAPANFGPSPPMAPNHVPLVQGPPPFRPFMPGQPPPPQQQQPPPPLPPPPQHQPPPRMMQIYPNANPARMPSAAPLPFAGSNPPPVHSMAPLSQNVNSATMSASAATSVVYQQPPPPGVPVNQHPPRPVFYQPPINNTNYSHYEAHQAQPVQQQLHQQQLQQQQSQFYQSPVQSVPVEDDSGTRKDHNLKRMSGDSTDGGSVSFKQSRYNYSSSSRTDEDDELTLYRKKVEDQKKQREEYVRTKEEQRLKNQMQSFIQNNIKGILEKRERLLRKSETEEEKRTKVAVQSRVSNSRGNSGGGGGDTFRNTEEPDARRKVTMRSERTEESAERPTPFRRTENKTKSTSSVRSESNTTDKLIRRRSPSAEFHAGKTTVTTDSAEQRQLHKVIKIKYKDGTVAFKSIPVGENEADIRGGRSDRTKSLLTVDDDGRRILSSGSAAAVAAQRRMVVAAKRPPSANVNNDASDENAIVESIRKGVTQSSVPLAQRFANLRASTKSQNMRPF